MSHLLAYIFPLAASQDSEGYTYIVPETLKNQIGIGDLVTIPFREDTQEGVVADLREVTDIPPNELEELKSVELVRFPAILAYSQIQAIAQQANELCVHIHKVLALFLPSAYIKRIFKHEIQGERLSYPQERWELKKNMTLCYMSNKKELISYAGKFLLMPGSLVIAPNQRYIDEIMNEISEIDEETRKNIYIFPADATETQKTKAFVEARIGTSKSMIGGRRLVFCNLARFERVLYLEDGLFKEVYHSFHKYRIFDMLSLIAQSSPYQVFSIASVTPSIEVASMAIAKKIGFESLIQK